MNDILSVSLLLSNMTTATHLSTTHGIVTETVMLAESFPTTTSSADLVTTTAVVGSILITGLAISCTFLVALYCTRHKAVNDESSPHYENVQELRDARTSHYCYSRCHSSVSKE